MKPLPSHRASPAPPPGLSDLGMSCTDPQDTEDMRRLLRRLYAAGRQDLASARLLEGHVDAIQLIRRYAQSPGLADDLERSAWCGVWNADLPGNKFRFEDGVFRGGKSFASGAGYLTHGLVTTDAGDPAAVQLWLVDLGKTPPHIDREWWQIIGMQASHTHRVTWTALPANHLLRIGQPGDYAREPWFSGGALRYVAVHAGGIAALFDTVRTHLIARERDRDPHQLARLARLFSAAETAAALCDRAAAKWFDLEGEARLAYVAHARLAVCDLAMPAIALTQEAIGVESLFHSHPASRILTDLMVYLRQPAPDHHREKLGKAAALGCLSPSL